MKPATRALHHLRIYTNRLPIEVDAVVTGYGRTFIPSLTRCLLSLTRFSPLRVALSYTEVRSVCMYIQYSDCTYVLLLSSPSEFAAS